MPKKIDRRDFLKSTAASVPFIAAGTAWSQKTAKKSPNGQVTLGCIGLGTHGLGWNLDRFLKVPDARIIAVCDVYADRREKARAVVNAAYGNSDCEMHVDFRDMLTREDIDAVVISTPDHWHVLMAVMAARAGKDVFCEKPTLNIEQGQILVREMNKLGVVYQGGIEDRSVDQYYRLAELVRNGAIGTLKKIDVRLPPGDAFPYEEEVPVPKGLDYDMWLGPAPYTPYTPTKLEPQQWRNVWDYSGGKLTDWGAHLMDTAQVAIFEELGGPLEVDGKGVFPEGAMADTATTFDIRYRYKNDVEMIVKSGGTGIRFEGTDGWVGNRHWRADLEASSPDILNATFSRAENKLWAQPPSEHVDFIQAVQNRTKTTYSPEDIHHLSTAMHLGNISMRVGRKIKWDSTTQTIQNDEEAHQYLSCPLRQPWSWT
jgi:hypothetical protein